MRALGALQHGIRLKILLMLSYGEFNVDEICRFLRRDQPTVSHHLALLRRAGIVTPRKQGRWIFYGLAEAAPAPGTIRVTFDGAVIEVRRRGR